MVSKQGYRVFIAEDDYLVSETISRVLGQIGCELAGKASDGRQAVEMVCRDRPDVVLMDIQMPGMDGLEASRLIQERCPTPIVILTAYESQELVDEASKAGVSAYLTKPPEPSDMARAIAVSVARHDDCMALRRMNADLQAASERLAAKSRELEAKSQELETKNAELQKLLEEVKTLRGILPVCSYCKKVRNDKGYWEKVDVYISDHTLAEISHGICPDCLEEHLSDFV